MTGPKGDLCYRLLSECLDSNLYDIRVVSGSEPDERFDSFKDKVNFTGYTNNVPKMLKESDLVIGAGRVAMESLLCGRPTLAVGESISIGLVTSDNLPHAIVLTLVILDQRFWTLTFRH